MRFFLILIVFTHALIHFIGFAKAFGLMGNKIKKEGFTKSLGLLWVVTGFFFFVVGVMLLVKDENWWMLSGSAIIVSQALIIYSWRDARFGTIGNILILLATITAYGSVQFDRTSRMEAENILARVNGVHNFKITRDMLSPFPAVVQKWLVRSGIVGKDRITTVRLKQKGQMRLKPSGNWLPFEAQQYFTVDEPAFLWTTQVQMWPLIKLSGRDKFENGEGNMNIKLLSLFNVVREAGNEKINSATMVRYLAETSWFPSAALSEYIKWEGIDSTSAKAIMTFNDISVMGIFTFDKNGDMISFAADRYFNSDSGAVTEKWLVQSEAWREFEGVRIPCKSKVTWKLTTGDFSWAEIELTEVEYNKNGLYN